MGFDRSEFINQYKEEVLEHIQRLSAGLLKLEKAPKDIGLLDLLMRETHTIKGTSLMMGYKRIADITHSMESAFQKALDGSVELTDNHFDLLFKCLDSMIPLLEDKIVWEGKGMMRPFVDDLCKEVSALFSGSVKDKEISSEPRAPEAIGCGTGHDAGSDLPRAAAASGAYSESLRVEVSELNKLMNLSGELIVAKTRLNELALELTMKARSQAAVNEGAGMLIKELNKINQKIFTASHDIQQEVMKIRMVPVAYLFDQFPRAMRDLARGSGKDIDMEIEGSQTLLDKAILDEMKEPIMHLLRNAVDHGIECSMEREKRNKPLVGKVLLGAYQAGSQVVIEVSDDGNGIDMEKVRRRALGKGFVTEEKLGQMSEDQIFQVLFMPGFSTTDDVTETSGRGVGLEVVKEKLMKLNGTVEIESHPGRGTKFTMKMPLTLAITECLLVGAGNDIIAIPIESVTETLRIEPSMIKTVEAREAIIVKGRIMPLVRAGDIFDLPVKGITERRFFSVVIVRAVEKSMALLVDELRGRQNIVIKALGDPLSNIRYISGATILGDGRVILIADIPSIIDSFEGGLIHKRVSPQAREVSKAAKKRLRTILLVEDAMSTAMLEKNILESAGFSVVIARDGQEGLEKCSQEKFDLVVTDILMPRMDGFELASALKKDKLHKEIPIIIVTTRESDADKRRGLECGADAYILKSEFTSEGLLNIIERLIG